MRRAGFLVASGLVLASVQIKAVKIQDPDNPQKKLDDFWGPSQKMLNDLGPDKFKQGELNVSLPSSFAFYSSCCTVSRSPTPSSIRTSASLSRSFLHHPSLPIRIYSCRSLYALRALPPHL